MRVIRDTMHTDANMLSMRRPERITRSARSSSVSMRPGAPYDLYHIDAGVTNDAGNMRGLHAKA
jgi:hypothetical protein